MRGAKIKSSQDWLALRIKLRDFKHAISPMDAKQISEEIEKRSFADSEFIAHVIAALELAHRKSPDGDAVLHHSCVAMDLIWSSPLPDADNKMCQCMIFVALAKSRTWSEVREHFGEKFPPRLKYHEASNWVRSILEFSRRVKFKRKDSPLGPFYGGGSDHFSVDVKVNFGKPRKV